MPTTRAESKPCRVHLAALMGCDALAIAARHAVSMRFRLPRAAQLNVTGDTLFVRRLMLVSRLPLTQVLWAYAGLATIAGMRVQCLNLHLMDGRRWRIVVGRTASGADVDVQAALELISAHAPWVVLGYDTELERLWRNDRREFIERESLAAPPSRV